MQKTGNGLRRGMRGENHATSNGRGEKGGSRKPILNRKKIRVKTVGFWKGDDKKVRNPSVSGRKGGGEQDGEGGKFSNSGREKHDFWWGERGDYKQRREGGLGDTLRQEGVEGAGRAWNRGTEGYRERKKKKGTSHSEREDSHRL